jgi:hypothetical protein
MTKIDELMRLADDYCMAQMGYGIFSKEAQDRKDDLRHALEAAMKPVPCTWITCFPPAQA